MNTSFSPHHAELPSEIEIYDQAWQPDGFYFVLNAYGRQRTYLIPEPDFADVLLWLNPDCVEYHQGGSVYLYKMNALDPENDLAVMYNSFAEYRQDYSENWPIRKVIAIGLQTDWEKYCTSDEPIPFELGSLKATRHDDGGATIRTYAGEGEELDSDQVSELIKYLK